MRKAALTAALLGALLLPAAAAAERPGPVLEVGHATVAQRAGGPPSLLVPVTYPIQMVGHVARLRLRLTDGGATVARRQLRVRLAAGPLRRPERRRRFTFVHSFVLGPRLSARLGRGLRLQIRARAVVDANGDGKPELAGADGSSQRLTAADAAPPKRCSSIPRLRTRPGELVSVRLPVCGGSIRWRLFRRPPSGRARIRHGRLVYRPGPRFRGTAELGLRGAPVKGAGTSSAGALLAADAEITVGAGSGDVVRAIGDSVTAGFGYYSDGAAMAIGRLLECRPGEKSFDDACSSNSLNRSSGEGEVEYAADYGLSNDISWAAQWANAHGVTNYENLAISGSKPADWAPEGQFHTTTARVEAEDPDYILMTIGANPLLSNMLFGIDNMGCAVEADIVGGYRECIEKAFREVHLQANLRALYSDLVLHTEATIYLMQYQLSVPSIALAYSATQIAEMGKVLNHEIARVAAEVEPKRLQVVAPPHFNVGVDLSPVYPSSYSCSSLGYEVDGPSVQSTPTQDELDALHPLSFCKGPIPHGPPWVIGGDTGIHPSAAGYAQMAAQVPPPS